MNLKKHFSREATKKVNIMKKNTIFLLVIILSFLSFSACKNIQEENNTITYQAGNYYDKNWNDTVGTYTGTAIPDKETALEVAKAIFSGMDTGENMRGYVPKYIFYDEKDEVWIVSFGEDSSETTLGGDCSIALQKTDGKVLRVWFGE